MKLWPGGLAVLFSHVIAAVMYGETDARKSRRNIRRQHPVSPILRMVIVAVDREAVCTEEVVTIAVIVFLLCADLVVAYCELQTGSIRYYIFVGVGAVAWITDDIGAVQGEH